MNCFMKKSKPVIYILLFFVSWQFLQLYNYAHAFNDNPQIKKPAKMASKRPAGNAFEQKMNDTQGLIKNMADELVQGKPVKDKIKILKKFRDELDQENDEVLKYFAGIRKHLEEKSLSKTILERHDKTVNEYKAKHKLLQERLENVAKSRKEKLKTAVAEAVKFLDENIHKKKHVPLDPNKLPHRMGGIKERKPRTTLKEYLKDSPGPKVQGAGIKTGFNNILPKDGLKVASLDVSGLLASMVVNAIPAPGPEDLAETIEVQFTQKIQDLAAQLDHDPLKIYNWVRNNIEFAPTYGSIQGADVCRMTKKGNAFDTSSLLIALLRASGIHARYVYGTVENPIEKAMNWVGGVTDPIVCGQIFTSCGIPAMLMSNGEKIVSVRIEHVWVEAYVDYVPSRGADHRAGDTWIPMDASFKQYTYTEGVNLGEAVPFDGEAFAEQLLNSATYNEAEGWVTGVDSTLIQNKAEGYLNQVEDYINTTMPGATVGDLVGTKEIIESDYPYLPDTLPHKIIVNADRYAELPDSLRHRVTINLIKDTSPSSPDFTVPKSLPELAGKKITLSYAPASQEDGDLINSFMPTPDENGTINPEDLQQLPAYLINMIPELRIDGELVATGPIVNMGVEERIDLTFFDPTGMENETVSNYIVAGEYHGIVLNAQNISQEQMDNLSAKIESTKTALEEQNFGIITRDDLAGDLLYSAALAYYAVLDLENELTAGKMNMIWQRFPSEGSFSATLDVSYLGNVPMTASPGGLMMDIDYNHCIAIPKDNDMEKVVQFGITAGNTSSMLEHWMPEQIFSTEENPVEGISAVKALMIANDNGIPIYYINQDNISTILPQLQVGSDVIYDIENAVNAGGKEVIVSETNIEFNNWVGCGYVIFDPDTGSGAYMISGNKNGAVLIATSLILLVMLIIITGGPVAFVGFAVLGIPVFADLAALFILIAFLVHSTLYMTSQEYCEMFCELGLSEFLGASAGGNNVAFYIHKIVTMLGMTQYKFTCMQCANTWFD